MVILWIGLSALARFVGSRRFLSYVISGALGLAALASLSRDNQTRTVARIAAWDKQRSLRDKRAVEARLRKGEARLRRNRQRRGPRAERRLAGLPPFRV